MKTVSFLVQTITGTVLSVWFSLMVIPAVVVIPFGFLDMFLFPIPMLLVNVILGYVFLGRETKIMGVTIIGTGSVISVYFALAIFGIVPFPYLS